MRRAHVFPESESFLFQDKPHRTGDPKSHEQFEQVAARLGIAPAKNELLHRTENSGITATTAPH